MHGTNMKTNGGYYACPIGAKAVPSRSNSTRERPFQIRVTLLIVNKKRTAREPSSVQTEVSNARPSSRVLTAP